MTTPTTKRKAYHRSIPYGVGSAGHRHVLSRKSHSTSTSPRSVGESTTPISTGYIQDATAPLATRQVSFLRYAQHVTEDLRASHRSGPVHHLSDTVKINSHRKPFLIPTMHITCGGATIASVATPGSTSIRYKHENPHILLQQRHLEDGSYGLQIRYRVD